MGLIIYGDILETNVVEASSQLSVNDALIMPRYDPCTQFRSRSFLFLIDISEEKTANKF